MFTGSLSLLHFHILEGDVHHHGLAGHDKGERILRGENLHLRAAGGDDHDGGHGVAAVGPDAHRDGFAGGTAGGAGVGGAACAGTHIDVVDAAVAGTEKLMHRAPGAGDRIHGGPSGVCGKNRHGDDGEAHDGNEYPEQYASGSIFHLCARPSSSFCNLGYIIKV